VREKQKVEHVDLQNAKI